MSAAIALLGLWTRPAEARTYSPYERRTLALALERVGGRLDPAPEPKLVESVEIVRLDVVDERDPFPGFVNSLHATTREYIVERELLLWRGRAFSQRLSDETERNLRGLFLFSVVIAAPLEGSAPGRVRYLVVTKDLWSLRAGWDGRFANGALDYLSVNPSETNLFGTGRVLSLRLAATISTKSSCVTAWGLGFAFSSLSWIATCCESTLVSRSTRATRSARSR